MTLGRGPAEVPDSVLLADHTTLRVGGPARRLVVARSEAEIVETVRGCDEAGEPLLILSGGSNLLIGDDGFDGTVLRIATTGIKADVSDCGGAVVRVAAGEVWDEFVAEAVSQGWVGVEALSGIPGLAGATPLQNVGAYGADVSQTIASVRTFDRQRGQFATFPLAECGFGYRTSRFKQAGGRYVVVEVVFHFPLGDWSAPIRYSELAGRLGVREQQRAPLAAVREAVLGIRAAKGMVLDPDDHDTWSAGSFFTNPILDADAELPEGAPRYPAADGRIKTSAAWLIERAGFGKGHLLGPAGLSTKHVLALTNRGGAQARDIVALARQVRDGVAERFGVVLVPEPVLVGVEI
ncbi:MAG: UDP-N-acetylmuramate dehydrogenase [Propionibacteriaceae bacterium]|nr:UDP-N-acetylmuramate dehydrogenase [Propionibacteriaceae bacterium]